MKPMIVLALIVSQLSFAVAPASGATINDDQMAGRQNTAAFAGARLIMPLGSGQKQPHVGLALTSLQRNSSTGTLRFAPGLELGASGNGLARLTISGQRLGEQLPGLTSRKGQVLTGRKAGVSTVGWVLIGVGTVAALAIAALAICQETYCTDGDS